MFQFDGKQIPLFWCYVSTKKNNLGDKGITKILSIKNYTIQEKNSYYVYYYLLYHKTMICVLKL